MIRLLPVNLLLLAPAFAQEFGPGNIGFARVVNAVGLESPTTITVGQLKLYRGEPVPVGGTSGVISLYSGPNTIEVVNEACDPPNLKATFNVKGGATSGVVIYHTWKEGDDGEMIPELQYSGLSEGKDREAPELTLVSLSKRQAVPVKAGGKTFVLNPKVPQKLEVKLEQVVSVNYDGDEIANVECMVPGHYLVFVFDDPEDGAIKGVSMDLVKYDWKGN